VLQSIFDREQARTSLVELEALQETVTRSDVNDKIRAFLADESDLAKELRAKTDSLRRSLNELE
jgi:hypothetical protein